jgi:hypothetical protein
MKLKPWSSSFKPNTPKNLLRVTSNCQSQLLRVVPLSWGRIPRVRLTLIESWDLRVSVAALKMEGKSQVTGGPRG